MLTIEEIKKELEAGNTVELECIDEMGFISRHECNVENNEIILNQGRLTIATVCNDTDSVILKGNINPDISNTIHFEELQYFRIKRPTLTFNDLIDVAVQAFKDSVIFELDLEKDGICFKAKNLDMDICQDSVEIGIETINSLYTETFVIEYASDMERIKRTAIIVLENGCEVCAESDCLHHGVNYIQTTYGGMNFNLSFVSLKGATVTQKRGVA